jgi:hypothetical protein
MRTGYVRCGWGVMLNFSGNNVENSKNTIVWLRAQKKSP